MFYVYHFWPLHLAILNVFQVFCKRFMWNNALESYWVRIVLDENFVKRIASGYSVVLPYLRNFVVSSSE